MAGDRKNSDSFYRNFESKPVEGNVDAGANSP
jgi:hypothetical protein